VKRANIETIGFHVGPGEDGKILQGEFAERKTIVIGPQTQKSV
jgi:hypothetical protein